MKRPLCVVSVVFVLILFFFQLFFSNPQKEDLSWMEQNNIQQGEEAVISGTVLSCQQREQYKVKSTELILDHINMVSDKEKSIHQNQSNQTFHSNSKIVCYINKEETHLIGSKLTLSGKISFYAKATNPGEFDAYSFYCNRGYLFVLTDGNILDESTKYSKWKETMWKWKQKMNTSLSDYLTLQDAALIKGMLLGDKTEIDHEIKDVYQKAGISHILAISGLHISLIGMGVYALFCRLPIPSVLVLVCSFAIVIGYSIMVGSTPSSFRAVFMFSMMLLAKICRRSYDIITSLFLSMMIFLIIFPGYLFDCGFQLSYGAIAGIAVLMPALQKICMKYSFFKKKHNKIIGQMMHSIWQSLLASISVFLTTAPILIWHFHELSFGSIFLNLLIVPLMSVLLVLSFSLIFFSWLFPPLALIIAYPIHWILFFFEKSAQIVIGISFYGKNIAHPALWIIIVYYILVFVSTILVNKKKYWMSFILTGCGLCLLFFPKQHDFSIWTLDVGQGDSSVIFNENKGVYMIDGGSSSKKNVGEKILIPFLKYHGVSRIEGVFLSHPDEDHMNGMIELIEEGEKERISIACIFVYEETLINEREKMNELIRKAGEHNIRIVKLKKGDQICQGNMQIECLYPGADPTQEKGNNASLVLSVSFGNFHGLFVGDLEAGGEEILCKTVQKPYSYSYLKVGHHGSGHSSGLNFLNWASPMCAGISCGEKNPYGHPHKDTIKRLEDEGCIIFRTDQSGAFCFHIKKDRMRIEEFLGK